MTAVQGYEGKKLLFAARYKFQSDFVSWFVLHVAVAVLWLIPSNTSGNSSIVALSQQGEGASSLPGKKSPGEDGEGKILPRCPTPCPAGRAGIPQHRGAPQEGTFLDFQEKSLCLPAEELKCRNGCSQLVWVLCVCKGRVPWGFWAGGSLSWPCLAFFHGDSHSSRAGMDPKGLLQDWVGSVAPHTQPGRAEKPSFYNPLSCFLLLKLLKTTPLLLQVPWPQCPHMSRGGRRGDRSCSPLCCPQNPNFQPQSSTSLPPPDEEKAPVRGVMPLSASTEDTGGSASATSTVTGQAGHWHPLQTQLCVHPATGALGVWRFFVLFSFLKKTTQTKQEKHIVAKQ